MRSKSRLVRRSHRAALLPRPVFLAMALMGSGLIGSPTSGQPVASTSEPPSQSSGIAPAPSGTLELRVAVVAADLSLKPVPKQRFLIIPDPQRQGSTEDQDSAASSKPLAVTTGFDGTLRQAVPPGLYRIQTDGLVDLEGKRFSWDVAFEIGAGATTVLELSNDNARIEAATPAEPGGLEAGALYERYREGVFKIIADGGHGSGFLVSEDGLILTNHHVIADAGYLATKIDDRHKYQVALLSEDATHDLAVLRIHPDAVRGRPVLPLAEDRPEKAPVSVGETVVAIGSPLTTETLLTTGVVSKVQEDVIYSDVSINPGNSGGPLLDRRGQVVGVNTFGVGGAQGPGLSGITRIHRARSILEHAREKMRGAELPLARPLLVEASYRFPPETIRELALATDRVLKDYHIEAGKLDVQLFTPVLIASEVVRGEREAAEARKKRRKGKEAGTPEDSGQPSQRFYAWQKDGDNFRPVIRIRVRPEVKLTAGSAFLVGLTGSGGKLRFKTDFERMELQRDGKVIEPIHPGRIKEVVNIQGPGASLKDIGYWGMYEYAPEAFVPGATLALHVWEQGVPEPHRLPLPDELLAKIREDFKPYLETLGSQPPAGP